MKSMNNLDNIAKAIKETNKPQKVTPRILINAVRYERHSPNACRLIDEFLEYKQAYSVCMTQGKVGLTE